jgi:hypothetical protein
MWLGACVVTEVEYGSIASWRTSAWEPECETYTDPWEAQYIAQTKLYSPNMTSRASDMLWCKGVAHFP